MAVSAGQPRLRRAWFGGVHRGDVEALVARLAKVESELGQARAENERLTADLGSVRLALGESAGWSERLPAGLRDLASVAAGDLPAGDAEGRLGAAVLAVGGEHLLAQVEVSLGDPVGELECETTRNENNRPVRTTVRLGGCVVDCVWQPGVDAGPDTAGMIEDLCSSVVCSLAGVVASRVERDVVSQLGDQRALARHEALLERLGQPGGIVRVLVDQQSTVSYRELYGRVAWSAALADAAATLERIARAHGGQAYHPSDLEFRLLLPGPKVQDARELVEEALAGYEGLVFDVGVVS